MAYEFYTREQWGAAPPRGSYTRVPFGSTAVIHHTAGFTSSSYSLEGKPGPKWYKLYSKHKANRAIRKAINAYEKRKANVVALEKKAMRDWQAFHQRGHGWLDIGYHLVIFPSGHVYEGRPWNTHGAHAVNGNTMPGISFAGNFEVQAPTRQALASFRFEANERDLKHFIGHYKVPGNSTACPGKNLKRALGV